MVNGILWRPTPLFELTVRIVSFLCTKPFMHFPMSLKPKSSRFKNVYFDISTSNFPAYCAED